MDVLSEVLSAIHLTGSVFFDITAASPWVAEAPPSAQIADAVMPGAQHAIEYHVITRGACWISLVDGEPFEPMELNEGDIVVVPHGEPHTLSSSPGMRAEPNLGIHRRPEDDRTLPFQFKTGQEGPVAAHVICGFFTCDVRPFNPLLESLPRFLHIRRDALTGSESVLDQFIRFASAETDKNRLGRQSVLNRLSELMFVEAIRLHMDRLESDNTGWLAGLRDPLVGRALVLLHARPTKEWTLETLAAEAGASRSVLGARFNHLMGYPPMQYLTRWRMQLAARRLTEMGEKVAAVAEAVGYDSEAAFSRAFKKYSGVSPSEWRAGRRHMRA
jgi:AraC-like DNA-binding protein